MVQARHTIEEWREIKKPKPTKMTKTEYERYCKKRDKVAIVGAIIIVTALLAFIGIVLSLQVSAFSETLVSFCFCAGVLGVVLMHFSSNVNP
jgi:high-affinity Fe2+/Pb2+ permease